MITLDHDQHKRRKRALRAELRERRRAFGGERRQSAEAKITRVLFTLLAQHPLGAIAVYFPFDGEVDISSIWGGGLPIIEGHQDPMVSRFVFPVHEASQPLCFVSPSSWNPNHKLPIPSGRSVPLNEISLIITPGVAFDHITGIRLGLGGGHYDRTLKLCAQRSWTLHAFGVGFNFQQRDDLPREPWDVPLDGLVTERGIHVIKTDAVDSTLKSSPNERETP